MNMKRPVKNLKGLSNKMKTLAIIPARAGSKRLPGKNIKMLLDKPLVGWTALQAKRCHYFDRVIISTDCQTIANIANEYGAEVPFLRPTNLAEDNSSSLDVVKHALDHYAKQGEKFDVIALLEPTSPLRTSQDLSNAMADFFKAYDRYDAVISVGKMEREHPAIMKEIDQRQRLKPFTGKKM